MENKAENKTESKTDRAIAIFGAQSVALGIYQAIRTLYPEQRVKCFLVTSLKQNPQQLAGLPVLEVKDYFDREDLILIATPENLHPEIIEMLQKQGFHNYIALDSRKEAALMELYYREIGKVEAREPEIGKTEAKNTEIGKATLPLDAIFSSLHDQKAGSEKAKLQVFLAKHSGDRVLQKAPVLPEWAEYLQVGAIGAQENKQSLEQEKAYRNSRSSNRIGDAGNSGGLSAGYRDCDGVHISGKNPNYCELTALYWIWKNRLSRPGDTDYYGLFHYRRILDIQEADLFRLKENQVDAVLPYPMLYEPDIRAHHTRYVKDGDWQAMRAALIELQPRYAEAFDEIFTGRYFYNYNILVATPEVFADYCAWLFPILERIEELCQPEREDRADRYMGYLGENLLTLYFRYHSCEFKIVHTGRLMLT